MTTAIETTMNKRADNAPRQETKMYDPFAMVIIGIDTHTQSHTAGAIDERGVVSPRVVGIERGS